MTTQRLVASGSAGAGGPGAPGPFSDSGSKASGDDTGAVSGRSEFMPTIYQPKEFFK